MRTVVEKHFDEIAKDYDSFTKKRNLHYSTLKSLLKSLIPKNKKVLEVGCGTGDILSAISPKSGYGLDISSEMVVLPKNKHKEESGLMFSTSWPKGEKYDYIFMTDVIEHLEDPEAVLVKIVKLMSKETLFINSMANPLWEPVLMFWENMGWKMKEGPHKRLRYKDIEILCKNVGLRIVKHDYKLLIPINIPFVTKLANIYLEKYLKRFAFIEYFVAVRSRIFRRS